MITVRSPLLTRRWSGPVIGRHTMGNISVTVRPQHAAVGAVVPTAAPYAPPVSFTVGFDLDMTLIDPRAGIVEVFDVLAAETGIPLDGRAFVTRLGPPLRHEFERYGLDETTITELVERYRALTPELAIPRTVAMPGAVRGGAGGDRPRRPCRRGDHEIRPERRGAPGLPGHRGLGGGR